jgi:hypothetical protein
MASCGPGRRSRLSPILDVALLRLRLRKVCGLGLNHNLPLLDEHWVAEGGRLLALKEFYPYLVFIQKWHPAVQAGVLAFPQSST